LARNTSRGEAGGVIGNLAAPAHAAGIPPSGDHEVVYR
jgi:hypothetical protein